MERNFFRVSLLISVLIHTALFLNPSVFKFVQIKSKQQKIEINYLNIKTISYSKTDEIKKEISAKITKQNRIKKIQPPPFVKRDDFFKESIKTSLPRFPLPKPDVISVKKIIQLKPVEVEKINNPLYINYYQTVREKIRRCAYHNYARSDTGQVYLTFIVTSEGILGDVRIDEGKTNASFYLKDVALRSIRDASPFPKFPPELDYPQLTFNVIISFEIE